MFKSLSDEHAERLCIRWKILILKRVLQAAKYRTIIERPEAEGMLKHSIGSGEPLESGADILRGGGLQLMKATAAER